MVLAGLGCIALFFVGPPGGTAGNVPTESVATPAREFVNPTDKTLYLTVPKIGVEDVKVHDSVSEEKLEESTIHVPDTGFPW